MVKKKPVSQIKLHRITTEFHKIKEQPSEVFCKIKVFLKILQNSQENTYARVSFLIKLQASGL